jgi:hypothetical protein
MRHAAAVFSLLLISLASCCKPPTRTSTSVVVSNRQGAPTTVYVAFGSDSRVTQATWASFCQGTTLSCSFPLAAGTSQPLPNPTGAYLNATFSFGAAVGCGTTKGEINVNNPAWYDTMDVSLVDGFSNKIGITYTAPGGKPQALGPVKGPGGNETVLGVYPFGCDICVARQSPPCGIAKGTDGCKKGTQNKPDVPCQVQGSVKGGGGAVEIALYQ